ncbi:hypothetical protein BDV95DRAFT_478953 [Massariosphaeria phaeospora]|uniref:Uncharacterized protein n=1 Tax=Massariosphaeria phaeospora TaxID=100035 RepID=A0A7C8MJ00_9PLEO|nr:hypothetical protein BDV95DRAFT_478953 [Massariosphaeria phaeospora]
MQKASLSTSKYATRTPAESAAFSQAERIKEDKAKTGRLMGRLRWKAESLMASYVRAVEILQAEVGWNGHFNSQAQHQYPYVLGTTSKYAESMFKVDFFEFYTLLERYITLCLSIMGVYVSGSAAPKTNINALKFITNPDLQRRRPQASHAFHANLLEALDQDSCPFSASLGNQDVRIQLGLAKDYRNRWKDADENISTKSWSQQEDDSRPPIKLDQLDLDIMIRTLLIGCAQAHDKVHGHADVDHNRATSQNGRDMETSLDHGMHIDDVPYEFMGDAMDLD